MRLGGLLALLVLLEGCSCTEPCGKSVSLSPVSVKPVVLRDSTADDAFTLVFVAEGFTAGQLPEFTQTVDTLTAGLLADVGGIVARAPDRFRFVRLDTPSSTSSVNNSKRGDTAWGGCFDEDKVARRSMLSVDEAEVADAVVRVEPRASVVIVVFNTTSGTAQTHFAPPASRVQVPVIAVSTAEDAPLLTHELGHALVWLGDEYVRSREPWPSPKAWFKAWAGDPFAKHANLAVGTTGTKWHDVLIGAQPGGNSFSSGLVHPTEDCRMNVSHSPSFCAVCSRELDRLFGKRDEPSPPRLGVLLAERPEHHRFALSAYATAFDWDGLVRLTADIDGESCFTVVDLDGGTLVPGDYVGPPGVRWETPVTEPRPLAPGPHVLTVKAYDTRGEVTVVTVPFTRVDASTEASRPSRRP